MTATVEEVDVVAAQDPDVECIHDCCSRVATHDLLIPALCPGPHPLCLHHAGETHRVLVDAEQAHAEGFLWCAPHRLAGAVLLSTVRIVPRRPR